MTSQRPVSPSTPLLRRESARLLTPFPNGNLLWKAGSLLAAVGVVTGAFGAHALKSRLGEADTLHAWQTASQYALFNGIALLGISMHPRFSLHRFAGPAICAGTVMFSGSIWTLTLDREKGFRWLGPVTPMGGMLMILGYLSLVL